MTVRTTRISWTDATWNPVTGCTKVSAGCDNCYAAVLTRRFGRQRFEDLVLHEKRLGDAAKFRPIHRNGRIEPRLVFVNSMSDLHHERVPIEFVHRVYDAMEANDQAIFQVLTKRPAVMRRFLIDRYGRSGQLPQNLWVGVSIEDDRVRKRIDVLRDVIDRHRPSCGLLSVEPLIGCVHRCDFTGVDWVIIGGESGSGARPMEVKWLRSAVAKARKAKGAVWFKQYGHARNNPIVMKLMKDEGLGLQAAFQEARALGLELAPSEAGGATFDGKVLQEFPAAWCEAIARLAQH